jgi:beta-glucanase (GH16 family)
VAGCSDDAVDVPDCTNEFSDPVSLPFPIPSVVDVKAVVRPPRRPVLPVGVDGDFDLVFSEDFSGRLLSPGRWTTCYWWDDNGCTNLSTKELQWYLPANVRLRNGSLVLTARPETAVGWKGRVFKYTSGMVTSGRYYAEDPSAVRFATTYGFFEIRAKVPSGQGIWPAFWLLPTTHESKPEIDIMEVLGHRPDVLEMHFVYLNDAGKPRKVGHEVQVESDLSKDFHVYAVEWSPEAIVWYLDGREMWRYEDTRRIPSEPMYMLLNLAVGGAWPGNPDGTTRFPAEYVIDYVRVWRRAID